MGAHVVYYCASKFLSPPRSPVLGTPAGPSSPVLYLTIWGQDRGQEETTLRAATLAKYTELGIGQILSLLFLSSKR